jgi:hypothetical protein
VDRVLLSNPRNAPADMVVALDELVLSNPEAIFLQSDHGLRDLGATMAPMNAVARTG